MTLSKNTVDSVQDFILEFYTKNFTQEQLTAWAILNLPNYSKDTFYFFKRTLKLFYFNKSDVYYINLENVKKFWVNSPEFLEKLNGGL